MANALQQKLLLNPPGPFKVISATRDTLIVNMNGIHNMVSRVRLRLTTYKAQGPDGIDLKCSMQNARIGRIEEETNKNDVRIIEKFQGQHIGQIVGTGRRMKFIAQW